MVKAIETRYAGCHFRSRLEARWAIFFDEMGWSWEYEPQGYELPSGRYLPDFRVRMSDGHEIWVEVKGTEPTEHEQKLMSELVQLHFSTDLPMMSMPYRGIIVSQLPRAGHPELAWRFSWEWEGPRIEPWRLTDRVERAFVRARSARFEHGQSGPT